MLYSYSLKQLLFTSLIGASLFVPKHVYAQNNPPALPPPIPSQVASNPDLTLNPDALEEYEFIKQERLEKIKKEVRERAFERAKNNYLPLEEDEIIEFMTRLRETQRTIQKPSHIPPQPDIHVEDMKLDPSAIPPTILLATDNVTSLTVLDITGEPWPIVDIGFGGPYDVKPPEPGGHVVRITPLKEFASGNMSIRLLDFSTPLTFALSSGSDKVHYRFDARIPERGPNATLPIISGGLNITAGDTAINGILEGIKPHDAEDLAISGADGRTSAYRLSGNIYVRTPHTMLSPSWKSSASSADGTKVYVINNAPVVILSDNGSMKRVQLKEKEISYDK